MAAFAAIVVVVGIIAIIYGLMEKTKAGRVMDAPFAKTGDVANGAPAAVNAKGMTSVEGNVLCQAPLTSPVTGTPCLYYQVKTTATWKEGETSKTRDVDDVKAAAPFWIDDGTGAAPIDATKGGDFEPTQRREQNQSTGLIAGVTGKPLVFGAYSVNTMPFPIGAKFYVTESVLPLVPRLYACGKLEGGRVGSPGFRNLILSAKSRDELLASAQKTSKMALVGGAAAIAVGVVLGVVGNLMGAHDAPKGAAAASTAAPNTTAKPATAPPKKK